MVLCGENDDEGSAAVDFDVDGIDGSDVCIPPFTPTKLGLHQCNHMDQIFPCIS